MCAVCGLVCCGRVIDSRVLTEIYTFETSEYFTLNLQFVLSLRVNDSRFICTSSKLIGLVKNHLFKPNRCVRSRETCMTRSEEEIGLFLFL